MTEHLTKEYYDKRQNEFETKLELTIKDIVEKRADTYKKIEKLWNAFPYLVGISVISILLSIFNLYLWMV